jgi:hypothetical protein
MSTKHPESDAVAKDFNIFLMDSGQHHRCDLLTSLQKATPGAITCLKGGMGARLSITHVFDKLGKDDDPVDLNMKSDVLAMFSPSDFDVMIFDRKQEQIRYLSTTTARILKEHSERMKPHLIQAVKFATEKNGINAQLNKLNIMTMMKNVQYPGEVLELHRIVIAVPTDQGACVCDYVDIAIPLTGDKIFEVDDVDLELSTCFDGRQIKHTGICAQMSLLETAAMNWRLGRTELSTSKHIERYLTLRAMCVDPSPLPFVKDEDPTRVAYRMAYDEYLAPVKAWLDHKTNKNSFAMNKVVVGDSSIALIAFVSLFTSVALAILPSVYW